jgi:hypothetical protein
VRGPFMWRYVLLLGIVIASAATSWCDTVQFTVDPANTGIVYTGANTPFIDLFSAGLNGTVLTGQSLPLDLMFSHQVLARLFLNDPGAFGVELIVYTNAGTFPGFAGPTTGFLLDPNGIQFGGTQVAGKPLVVMELLSKGWFHFLQAIYKAGTWLTLVACTSTAHFLALGMLSRMFSFVSVLTVSTTMSNLERHSNCRSRAAFFSLDWDC